MKSMNAFTTIICVGLLFTPLANSQTLTQNEQADAFHARGLAAEQRGDVVSAKNCYTLALRVIASHPAALASLDELEEKLPLEIIPTASHTFYSDRVEALNDGKEPSSSSDSTIPRFTWHPKQASFEWVQYDFSKPQAVERCDVYWYDDNGGVKLPEFWKVLYLDDAGTWMPVDGQVTTPVLNAWNTCHFKPVRTRGLRLAVQLGSASAGILEWKIIPSSDQAPPPLPQPEEMRLDDLLPITAETGWGSMQVNRYFNLEGERTSQVLLDGQPCTRFLFAHADSRVSYAVPLGYVRFSALGISPVRPDFKEYTWSYKVFADETLIFESQLLETYPDMQVIIDVDLPAGTSKITLVTDANGNGNNDHAIWANPRLIRSETIPEKIVKHPAETDFKAWLKTVQLKHGQGDGVIWTLDDGFVLHYSQTDPKPKVQRFEIIAIDPETRTVTWKQPGSEHAMRINPDYTRFEWRSKDNPFVLQPLDIEPRDAAIFGVSPTAGPALAAAPTPAEPLVNSLGMKFVPVPGTKVLFCIHETRRQDYAAFAAAESTTDGTWKTVLNNGVPCGHLDDHPVVGVGRDDARGFCAWLTQKEGRVHRLPTDEEWSRAVGVADFEKRTAESTPEQLNMKEKTQFPWGGSYPPKSEDSAGNYADTKWKETFPSLKGMVEGYTDNFETTAPVMSFKPNSFGLFDLGGNAWEWVDDPWQGAALGGPTMRGASFGTSGADGLLSSRRSRSGRPRPVDTGFRVVIEVKGGSE